MAQSFPVGQAPWEKENVAALKTFQAGQAPWETGSAGSAAVDEIKKQLNPGQQEEEHPLKSFLDKTLGVGGEVVKGVAKGLASTSIGALDTAEKYVTNPALKAIGKEPMNSKIPDEKNLMERKNLPQKIGFGAEQLAELFVPTPLKAGKGAGLALKVGSEAAEFGAKAMVQSGGDAKEAGVAALTAGAMPIAGAIVKTPLTMAAEKMYGSALKAGSKNTPAAKDALVKTGLNEKIWLTNGGVEKVANRIDEFETQLGEVIESKAKEGGKIALNGIKGYVDEAKKFFQYDADVVAAKAATKELDDMVTAFAKEYGDEIPIDIAQKIKVSTGQALRKYYDKLSAVGIEGRKQMTRFLKDKIVDKAPVVGDINARLKSLYEFDKALGTSVGRAKNLNLLGLGTKFGAAAGGKIGAAVGLAMDILDRPGMKSGAAIGINEMAKLFEKAGTKLQIPANLVARLLIQSAEEDSGGEQPETEQQQE